MKLKRNYEEILKNNGFESAKISKSSYEYTLYSIAISIDDFINKYLSDGKYKITNIVLNRYFKDIEIDFCKKDYINYCDDYFNDCNSSYSTKNNYSYNTGNENILEIIINELETYNLNESLDNYIKLLKEFEYLYYSQDFYFFDNLSNFIKTISDEFEEHIYDAKEKFYDDLKELIFIDEE